MQVLILYALLGCVRAQENSSIDVLKKYLRQKKVWKTTATIWYLFISMNLINKVSKLNQIERSGAGHGAEAAEAWGSRLPSAR